MSLPSSATLSSNDLRLETDPHLPVSFSFPTSRPVPLGFLTVSKDGKAEVDHKAFLTERSTTIDLKGASLFKLNSGTTGVYR